MRLNHEKSSFLFLLIIVSMIFYLTLNNSFYDKFVVTSGVVDTIEPNKLSNKSIDSYLKKTSYTKTVNNIISSSQVPSGYTLISSTTEYVSDYLGPVLTNDYSALSVKFGTCNLGSHSFVQITSLNDGFSQKLNAQRLVEWRNYSAFFNGHYVKIEVFEHNTDSNIFCDVERLVVTDTSSPPRPPCNAGSVCGNTATDDLDRILSSHPAVARRMGGFLTSNPNYEGLLTSSSETVWLTSNGGFASAGHVVETLKMFNKYILTYLFHQKMVPFQFHRQMINMRLIFRLYLEVTKLGIGIGQCLMFIQIQIQVFYQVKFNQNFCV